MAQKDKTYISSIKRWVEQLSADRFVFWNSEVFSEFKVLETLFAKSWISFCFLLLFTFTSCGEPEIRLTRADRRTIDTLVNYQLDSISPILDSLCKHQKETFIKNAVDSIIKERKIQEERLRLKISK